MRGLEDGLRRRERRRKGERRRRGGGRGKKEGRKICHVALVRRDERVKERERREGRKV